MEEKINLIKGDCLEVMKDIPDKSIDAIIADLPYGVTQNKYDIILPFDKLWEQYERIIKDNGAIVLFGQGLFFVDLINSNRKLFKYDLVWDGRVEDNKSTGTFTYTNKTKDEDYVLQGSIYRWINPEIIFDDFMAINYLFTDWKKFEQLQRPDVYPPADAHTQRFDLLTIENTETFIRGRIREIKTYKDVDEPSLPECTAKELWMSEPVFKYYADPNKMTRATKNFTSAGEAAAYKAKQGKGIVVEVSGEAKACAYCAGYELCSQKDKLIAQGLLKPKE